MISFMIKKIIKKSINISNKICNFILLKYCNVTYGNNLVINGVLKCVSNNKFGIIIGNDVTINSCRSANPIGGDTRTQLFAKGNGKICIGNRCGISNSTLFACESIFIGNDVFIGGGTKIYDTDFHWIDFFERISQKGGATKSVKIKDGAFIGAHSIILKGVTIGEKSVVGAGSVVTKDIPDGEIWAGNPVKFIKKVSVVNREEIISENKL